RARPPSLGDPRRRVRSRLDPRRRVDLLLRPLLFFSPSSSRPLALVLVLVPVISSFSLTSLPGTPRATRTLYARRCLRNPPRFEPFLMIKWPLWRPPDPPLRLLSGNPRFAVSLG